MDIEKGIADRADDLKIFWKLDKPQLKHLTDYFNQVALMAKIKTMDDCMGMVCDLCKTEGASKPANHTFWIHKVNGKILVCSASDIRDERAKIY